MVDYAELMKGVQELETALQALINAHFAAAAKNIDLSLALLRKLQHILRRDTLRVRSRCWVPAAILCGH